MNKAKSNCCSQLVCVLYHLSPESGLVFFQIPAAAATVVNQVVLRKENNVAGRSEVDGASKLGHVPSNVVNFCSMSTSVLCEFLPAPHGSYHAATTYSMPGRFSRHQMGVARTKPPKLAFPSKSQPLESKFFYPPP